MIELPDTTTEAGQREASVMLARLMPDWEIEPGDHGKMWIKCPDYPHATTSLYQPVFMFLAWKVLNWAWVAPIGVSLVDWAGIQPGLIFAIDPAEAQRAWLDKILTLAIEAGMIEE